MKVPKEIRTYCPRCGKHQVFSVSIYKRGQERALAQGARRYRAKQRGYGGQKKPIQRKKAKVTKKVTLKLTCSNCGYIRHTRGVRLSRVEIKR